MYRCDRAIGQMVRVGLRNADWLRRVAHNAGVDSIRGRRAMGFISLFFGALIFHSIVADTEPMATAQARLLPEWSVYRAVVDTMRLQYPADRHVMIFVDTLAVPGSVVSLELARAMHLLPVTEAELADCAHLADTCPLPQDSATTVIRVRSSRIDGSAATVSVMVESIPPPLPNYFHPTIRKLGGATIWAVTLKRSGGDWTVTSAIVTTFID